MSCPASPTFHTIGNMEAAGWARPVPVMRSTALARQMQSVKQLLLLPFLAMDSVFCRNVQLKVYLPSQSFGSF